MKTLKENSGEREREDLLQELQVMKMLAPHANVVRLLGCCTDKGSEQNCAKSKYYQVKHLLFKNVR